MAVRGRKPTDWPWFPRVALITPRKPAGSARKRLEVGESAADLEGAGGRVVFVLDPDRDAQSLANSGHAY